MANNDKERLTIILSKDTKANFGTICSADNRSMSGFAATLIDNYIQISSDPEYLKAYNNIVADAKLKIRG
jgi:hypothetical protein